MINFGGIFHPNFPYHMRASVESSQMVLVEGYRPTGGTAEWTPGVGMSDDTLELVWTGYARIQPDKDWRARAREQGNEFNAIQAVRVQLGINRNLLGAVKDASGKIIQYGPVVVFAKDYVIRVTGSNVTGTEGLMNRELAVRNALSSTHPWALNLLCDASTK